MLLQNQTLTWVLRKFLDVTAEIVTGLHEIYESQTGALQSNAEVNATVLRITNLTKSPRKTLLVTKSSAI